MILDELEFVEGGSWQPIPQRVVVVQSAAYEGVHQCLCSLPGQHPANRTDVADVHVRGMADLVDICLHIQPVVSQHSQVACDRSDRDAGSKNAESFSKDVVVLTGGLDDDDFCLFHHEHVFNHPGSHLFNTVFYIANSPFGVKDLEGQIELGVSRIELHTQAVLVGYVRYWAEIKRKQLRPQHRPLWYATTKKG